MKETLTQKVNKLEKIIRDMRHTYEAEHTLRLIAEGKLEIYKQISLSSFVEEVTRAVSSTIDGITHVIADLRGGLK